MRQKGESVAVHGAENKRAHWVKRVSEWRGSGQTQKAFCKERGVALSTFQWWRAKLSRGSKSKAALVSFVPVSVDAGSGVRDCAIEVELRSRTRLRLEGEAALRALDRLVARIR